MPSRYATDLIREDVLEFSRLQEINTMRVFFELLRERVGSPLSLASLARDLAVSPTSLRRYLDILAPQHCPFSAAATQGLFHRHRTGEGRRWAAL